MSKSIFIKEKPKKYPYVIASLVAVVLIWAVFIRPTMPDDVVKGDGEPKVYERVRHDVESWQASPQIKDDAHKFEKLKSLLGTTATKSDELDFNGAMADKYSYVANHEPPLYVIESKELFEVVWYFAHPKDNDDTKNKATAHAKKAHAVATALYGKDGTEMVALMLFERELGAEFLERHRLLSAQCQGYVCRFVVKK